MSHSGNIRGLSGCSTAEPEFNTVHMNTVRKRQNVRGLPLSIKSGIGIYKHACSTVSNKIGKKKKTWVDEFEHFAQLHNVSYTYKSDPGSLLGKMIDTYLKNVRTQYQQINVKSTHDLNKKLVVAQEEWMEQYGSIPNIPSKDSKIKKKKFDREEQTKLEHIQKEKQAENVHSEIETDSGSSQKEPNDKESLVRSNEETNIKKFQKKYEEYLRKIKENHNPTVYAAPGTPNFEYLCNSIRLMTSRKTICFSMDVEAYEFDSNVVTEIGISIYDPRENIHSLVPMTRNYHLIISEALPLRNKKWVCDFKDCYLLGESLVLSLHECVEFVQSLVNYYMTPQTVEDQSWSRAFVGHNVQGDIRWLREMGIKIPAEDSIDHSLQKFCPDEKPKTGEPIFILDTEKLFRLCYGSKGSNLGRLLRLFQIPHAFLHNAGNDAHYTLQLLMHMCDVNFRRQSGMDDLKEMSRKISQWIDREKEEPKILPMSYAVSVVEATKKRPAISKKDTWPKKKQAKDIVPQTEFGGSQWFKTAREAFESTLE